MKYTEPCHKLLHGTKQERRSNFDSLGLNSLDENLGLNTLDENLGLNALDENLGLNALVCCKLSTVMYLVYV